jgi:hypothetical protein
MQEWEYTSYRTDYTTEYSSESAEDWYEDQEIERKRLERAERKNRNLNIATFAVVIGIWVMIGLAGWLNSFGPQ